MFTDNTTKVDNEPPNGSNEDITNPYECEQTLNVSADCNPLFRLRKACRQKTAVPDNGFDTSARNPVKEILLKLNLLDHRILKDGGEVKEFQERCLIQAFKTKKQQQYEHVGPKVTSSQDGKVYKMAKRDYAWLMISRCSRSHIHIQVKLKEQAQA
ncbi:hypothetical protein Tco_0273192 [Tanacetum coccineum]